MSASQTQTRKRSRRSARTVQLHFPWVVPDSCITCLQEKFQSRRRRATRVRRQDPVIFTIRAAAAKERLVERYIHKSDGPPDLLEQHSIIKDLADYMSYLFDLGYRDFESNNRKLVEDLAAAVSQRADREREKQRERKVAAMMQSSLPGPGCLN